MRDYLLISKSGNIGTITIDRPEKRNAINRPMHVELVSLVKELCDDPGISVIRIKGSGTAFSSGHEMGEPDPTGRHEVPFYDMLQIREDLDTWFALWNAPLPVVTQVHGACFGVATLLCLCSDFTVVAEDARIGWPKAPVGGGMIGPMWAAMIGPRKAKEYSYRIGTEISGVEAVRIGFANHAVPADELDDFTMEMLRGIANTPRDLLQLKKLAINQVTNLQGFYQASLLGANWNSLAHKTPGVLKTKAAIRQRGLKDVIDEYR